MFSGQAVNLDVLIDKHDGSPPRAMTERSRGMERCADRFHSAQERDGETQALGGPDHLYRHKGRASEFAGDGRRRKTRGELAELQALRGRGHAEPHCRCKRQDPCERLRLSLVGFNAYPFLKDAAGFESIEGTAPSRSILPRAASERIMVERLSGSAKFDFSDGAIRGINIAKSLRSLSTGVLTGWQENPAEKTDFATLGASFKIAGGRAETSDLHLAGPLVRVAGAGSLDLPQQALKVRIKPELVANLEGQGGKSDLKGLGVAVMISVPWARPSIYPDIEGILTNPVAAYEQLNRLKGGLAALPGVAGGKAESGIGALIGNGKLAPNSLKGSAIDGIGQLLGAKAPRRPHHRPIPPRRSRQARRKLSPRRRRARSARPAPSLPSGPRTRLRRLCRICSPISPGRIWPSA